MSNIGKINLKNKVRDKIVSKTLKKDGWKVIKVLESEKNNKEKVINNILAQIEK